MKPAETYHVPKHKAIFLQGLINIVHSKTCALLSFYLPGGSWLALHLMLVGCDHVFELHLMPVGHDRLMTVIVIMKIPDVF